MLQPLEHSRTLALPCRATDVFPHPGQAPSAVKARALVFSILFPIRMLGIHPPPVSCTQGCRQMPHSCSKLHGMLRHRKLRKLQSLVIKVLARSAKRWGPHQVFKHLVPRIHRSCRNALWFHQCRACMKCSKDLFRHTQQICPYPWPIPTLVTWKRGAIRRQA